MAVDDTAIACPACGSVSSAGSLFCAACGTALPAASASRDGGAQSSTGDWPSPAEQSDRLLARLRQATLGDYDVAIELGRGGMAAVYLAHDLSLDRKVAIKVMLPEITSGPEMVERFRREARTAANLSHPHIIPIYQVRDVAGMVYFVMKFVEGRSLDAIVRERGPLPVRMVETILSQTAGALAYAHRRGIIHRDIKPANLMLDEDGWAVVTDFGIAKISDASVLTTTGATMGTPYYMSPEQCSSKPVTGASDQYSLGIAMYELLTGRPPFDGDSLMEVMSGHFFTPPTPVRERRPECPPALEAIIMRMVAKEPSERFADLDDVVAALSAPTLALNDPIRSAMVDLARSGSELRARVSVPISPIPLGRPPQRVSRPAPLSSAPPKSPPAPNRRWIVLGLVGVAATVAAFLFAKVPRTSETLDTEGSTIGTLSTPALAASDNPAQASDTPAVRPTDSVPTVSSAPPETERAPVQPPVVRPPAPQSRPTVARQTAAPPATVADREPPAAATAESTVTALDTLGRVLIGTRTPFAMLYVNGSVLDTLSSPPRSIQLRVGEQRLRIGATGCQPWDTTLTVAPDRVSRIGWRDLVCQ